MEVKKEAVSQNIKKAEKKLREYPWFSFEGCVKYPDFILEQLSLLMNVSYRSMMGVYSYVKGT